MKRLPQSPAPTWFERAEQRSMAKRLLTEAARAAIDNNPRAASMAETALAALKRADEMDGASNG